MERSVERLSRLQPIIRFAFWRWACMQVNAESCFCRSTFRRSASHTFDCSCRPTSVRRSDPYGSRVPMKIDHVSTSYLRHCSWREKDPWTLVQRKCVQAYPACSAERRRMNDCEEDDNSGQRGDDLVHRDPMVGNLMELLWFHGYVVNQSLETSSSQIPTPPPVRDTAECAGAERLPIQQQTRPIHLPASPITHHFVSIFNRKLLTLTSKPRSFCLFSELGYLK